MNFRLKFFKSFSSFPFDRVEKFTFVSLLRILVDRMETNKELLVVAVGLTMNTSDRILVERVILVDDSVESDRRLDRRASDDYFRFPKLLKVRWAFRQYFDPKKEKNSMDEKDKFSSYFTFQYKTKESAGILKTFAASS